VIARDLFELVATAAVHAAIAGPDADAVTLEREQSDNRAATHACAAHERLVVEASIHFSQSVLDVVEQRARRTAALESGEGLDDHATGHVAGVMAPHAVRDHPETGG